MENAVCPMRPEFYLKKTKSENNIYKEETAPGMSPEFFLLGKQENL